MELRDYQELNRQMLREAQAAELAEMGFGKIDNQQMMVYLVAAGIAVLSYFLMQRYTPDVVMSTKDGKKQFDTVRAVVASVVVGVLVLVVHHLCM
jgi:hypothetical protein